MSNNKESKQNQSQATNDNDNSDWGWEPIDKDDSPMNENDNSSKVTIVEEPSPQIQMKKKISNRSIDMRNSAMQMSEMSLKSGITSSPSFHELEMAIGATLAMSLNGSEGDLSQYGYASRGSFGAIVNGMPRVSSINQFNYSLNQQRLNKQRMIGMNPPRLYPQPISARDELNEFIRESESRALILFHSPTITPVVIRDTCQKYGVLLYIRPEFHYKGVTFVSYFDIRCAIKAYKDICNDLKSHSGTETMIHYSFMLQAANNNSEEHKILVKNLPNTIKESELESIFSRFGEVRSIERKSSTSEKETSDLISINVYCIEYFNIQDSRFAVSELLSKASQMWDSNVNVVYATISPNKQELCRQLLGLLSRWKNDQNNNTANMSAMMPPGIPPPGYNRPPNQSNYFSPSSATMPSPYPQNNYYVIPNEVNQQYLRPPIHTINQPPIQHPQLNMNPNIYNPNHRPYDQIQQRPNYPNQIPHLDLSNQSNSIRNQNIPNYPNNNISPSNYNNTNRSVDISNNNPNLLANKQVNNISPRSINNEKDTYNNLYNNHTNNMIHPQQISPTNSIDSHHMPRPQHHNNHANVRRPTRALNSQPTDTEFLLDPIKLSNNQETRTTIMVRNIPNKYTQRMLLEEVDVNNKGTYDFFYLPIDFKNKCNVGYCFINFLEPKYILHFMEEFNNHRWKNFNSEKICAITFARIQGRHAMITRFQNSSLLEKHDEYRPLLFYSSGPEKGNPEPFPSGPRFKGGSGYQSGGSSGSGHRNTVYGIDSASRSASTDQYDDIGSFISDKDSQRLHSSIDEHDHYDLP
mmetsp:Transcript_17284/g.15589  ORF Transcript_17284/g.15589 Transcript_17284/m.15589 type:complete len:807 (-) Transcript_17284:24-2444(-)